MATFLGGLVLALLGLLSLVGLLNVTGLPAAEGMGIGILFALVGGFFWTVIESGELVIARGGLYLAYDFIPWSAVGDCRADRSTFYLVTPDLRRFWNSWTGTVGFPLILFEVSPDLIDRVRQWRLAAVRGRS